MEAEAPGAAVHPRQVITGDVGGMPARLASPLLQFTKAARISGSVSGFTTDEASPRPDHRPNNNYPPVASPEGYSELVFIVLVHCGL
jgi:hypothetical protein